VPKLRTCLIAAGGVIALLVGAFAPGAGAAPVDRDAGLDPVAALRQATTTGTKAGDFTAETAGLAEGRSTSLSDGTYLLRVGQAGFGANEFADQFSTFVDDNVFGGKARKKEQDKWYANEYRKWLQEMRQAYVRVVGHDPDPYTLAAYHVAFTKQAGSKESYDDFIRRYGGGVAPGVTDQQRVAVPALVDFAYSNFLGRIPDAADRAVVTEQLHTWIREELIGIGENLRSGTSPEKFLAGVRDSAEARAFLPAALTAMFGRYLGRAPSEADVAQRLPLLLSGQMSRAQMEVELFGSPESAAYRGNLANQLVVQGYQSVLGRGPSEQDVASWAPQLADGWLTNEAFLAELAKSPENQAQTSAEVNATIVAVYQDCLRRAPDQPGIDHWGPLLATGQVTSDQFRQSVCSSPEAVGG
jgi:hypothetical protein